MPITNEELTPGQTTAAVLLGIADSIGTGQATTPRSIDIWSRDLSAAELLRLADESDLKIDIYRPEAGPSPYYRGHASIKTVYPAPRGARITAYYTSRDLSDQALSDYEAHNAECVADIPGAVHPTILDDPTRIGAVAK